MRSSFCIQFRFRESEPTLSDRSTRRCRAEFAKNPLADAQDAERRKVVPHFYSTPRVVLSNAMVVRECVESSYFFRSSNCIIKFRKLDYMPVLLNVTRSLNIQEISPLAPRTRDDIFSELRDDSDVILYGYNFYTRLVVIVNQKYRTFPGV